MILTDPRKLFRGAAGDSFLLTLVRIVTLALGIVTTRIMSGYFSLRDYGTYSTVMLLTNSVSSITILGMMDGLNFFFCREKDPIKKNEYVATIFSIQYFIGIVAATVVLICAVPISNYFGNRDVKGLLIFAAILPVLQNSISLLQIMFVAIGKVKHIAVRNLGVSILKLCAIIAACYLVSNIIFVLICQVITDTLQILYFHMVLKKSGCSIPFFRFNRFLVKEIIIYCIPIAMSTIVRSLYRDCDKYVISYFTDSETLAVYTNASKQLPFDLVTSSFCTVLLPYLTKYISEKRYKQALSLYRAFLELSFITTSILAIGAICAAPELMRFLYTEKYTQASYSVPVFILYIAVDIFVVFTITLLLSASGKTLQIMLVSAGTFALNIILDILLFVHMKEIGPALATLITTVSQGMILLSLSAKQLQATISSFFELKYYASFILNSAVFALLASLVRNALIELNLNYFLVLCIVYAMYCLPVIAISYKRIKEDIKSINEYQL